MELYSKQAILAALDEAWDVIENRVRAGTITSTQGSDMQLGIIRVARTLGLGDEFVNYKGGEPQETPTDRDKESESEERGIPRPSAR